MCALIFVVEDEPKTRYFIQRILEKNDFQVITAENGQEGLDILSEEKEIPDLIVSDIEMPKMNGYEVCTLIKQDAELQDVFIIMLTAKGQKLDEQRAIQAGADKYMTKPFDAEEILYIIEEIFYTSSHQNFFFWLRMKCEIKYL